VSNVCCSIILCQCSQVETGRLKDKDHYVIILLYNSISFPRK
jgi:hypothetical protein